MHHIIHLFSLRVGEVSQQHFILQYITNPTIKIED